MVIEPSVGVLGASYYYLQASGQEVNLKAHHQGDMFHHDPIHLKELAGGFLMNTSCWRVKPEYPGQSLNG
jgi:hypothetical protein